MTDQRQRRLTAALLFAIAFFVLQATGQTLSTATPEPLGHAQSLATPSAPSPTSPSLNLSPPASALQPLFDFNDSDIKFHLQDLMSVLRDRDHEGWVLAAYPDPKTSRPLIGAGFGLDVTATDHSQLDPLNSHLFLEPSSAQLWQAAGLQPERLQRTLDQFDRNLEAWSMKGYRRKIRAHTLPPELTEEEANSLLRISAIQAIHNARAYCRNFDQLIASQQMALSQLVYQMGVNLEEFVDFLSAMNGDASANISNGGALPPDHLEVAGAGLAVDPAEHWKTVQHTLIDSQWATHYTTRATTVIAMFDPDYAQDPNAAERRVALLLPRPAKHHHRKSSAATLRAANGGNHGVKKAPGSQSKPKQT